MQAVLTTIIVIMCAATASRGHRERNPSTTADSRSIRNADQNRGTEANSASLTTANRLLVHTEDSLRMYSACWSIALYLSTVMPNDGRDFFDELNLLGAASGLVVTTASIFALGPWRHFCNQSGPQFRFLHLDRWRLAMFVCVLFLLTISVSYTLAISQNLQGWNNDHAGSCRRSAITSRYGVLCMLGLVAITCPFSSLLTLYIAIRTLRYSRYRGMDTLSRWPPVFFTLAERVRARPLAFSATFSVFCLSFMWTALGLLWVLRYQIMAGMGTQGESEWTTGQLLSLVAMALIWAQAARVVVGESIMSMMVKLIHLRFYHPPFPEHTGQLRLGRRSSI